MPLFFIAIIFSEERFKRVCANPKVEKNDSSMPAPGGGFVGHLDRDGDGKVSREEFDGPADHFDILDKDGDGYLSESEAPPPPGQRPSF